MEKIKSLSVVVPVYNEAEGILFFHKSLMEVLSSLKYRHEIIYVDDGSRDDSVKHLCEIASTNEDVVVIEFSKNFGKEMATSAGIHASKGEAIMILDADGQHPVELIPKFINELQQGSDVVIGVRGSNQKEGIIKKLGSKLFYKSLRYFGVVDAIPGSTDFRIISRRVADEFTKLTEHSRITRSLIDWLGFDRKIIEFNAKAREHGQASYSFRKLVQLAMNGFVSLSFFPLYFSGYIGIFIVLSSFIASVFVVIEKYLLQDPLSLNITGTAFLGLMILFLVGILLVGQGLLALYVARIYSETQNRPLYVIKKKY